MYLIIKTDSETSDLGRISTPFTSLPTLEDIVEWNGKPLENDCNNGQEEGSIDIGLDGVMWKIGYLR